MKRNLYVVIDCLRKNKLAIAIFLIMTFFNGTVFFLYNIMREAFLYSEILIFVMLFFLLSFDYIGELKKAKKRENIKNNIFVTQLYKADIENLADKDYIEIIELLKRKIEGLQTEFNKKLQDDDDYYTTWIHQIKIPIAVMKLNLSENTEQNKAVLSEIFRIEQYVEMVLNYVRLGSNSNDIVIKEYEIDVIIREIIRKFASQFIMKKLKLQYEPAKNIVVTDKKWLTFILEQFISNAIKYTSEGEITISANDNIIQVSDTGIGIAAEDLPRIFEKGYTGMNGRLGQKSSGLGLFLTNKAAKLINADIHCSSTMGKGSIFTIILPKN